MRGRRVSLAVGLLASALVIAVLAAGALGTPTPTSHTGSSTHTLVITTTNGTGSYTVTASGTLQLSHGEASDYRLRGSRVSGTVGDQGDTKDVIQYTGYIESFQVDGSLQVTLDGQQIAPTVLAGQHIRISRSGNASQPLRYQFSVTGQASFGEQAEHDDTVNKTRIQGRVRDHADSFYFTGDIANNSISTAGAAQIQINGQNASVFLTHAPPTPTTTPSTTVPSLQTVRSTQSLSPTVTDTPPMTPPETQATPTAEGQHSTSSGGNLLTDQFVLGFASSLVVLIVAGLGAVLYLRMQ